MERRKKGERIREEKDGKVGEGRQRGGGVSESRQGEGGEMLNWRSDRNLFR